MSQKIPEDIKLTLTNDWKAHCTAIGPKFGSEKRFFVTFTLELSAINFLLIYKRQNVKNDILLTISNYTLASSCIFWHKIWTMKGSKSYNFGRN